MGRAGVKANRMVQETNFALNDAQLSNDYLANEQQYLDQVPEVHRKKFAQFFTPYRIAEMMCSWVMEIKPSAVLDPAVGPGVFPAVLRGQQQDIKLTMVDLDPVVLQVARRAVSEANTTFLNRDFLLLDEDMTFDGIVANPPYLRHHDFSYPENIFEVIGRRLSLPVSRLTNLYGLFVLEICRRLRPGGRAAVIIPTEWTNANFGTALKHYLIDNGLLDTLIYFSHESLPFADALTTASVLLLQKPRVAAKAAAVRTIYLERDLSREQLLTLLDRASTSSPGVFVQDIAVDVLKKTKKWDYLIKTSGLQNKVSQSHLQDLATTKRGIATGANDYFHLSLADANTNSLGAKYLRPCIGRSVDVKGLSFSENDFETLVKEERRTHLLCLEGRLGQAETAYMQKGIDAGLHERYLLAARKQWYAMENRPPAPIWAAVFGRAGLRFVRNKAGVLNLTAFHCCPRRFKSEPPCRPNFEPGLEADVLMVGCA